MKFTEKKEPEDLFNSFKVLIMFGILSFTASQLTGCGLPTPHMSISPAVESLLSFEDCKVRTELTCVLHNHSSYKILRYSIHSDFYGDDGVKIGQRDFPSMDIEPGQKMRAPIAFGVGSGIDRIEVSIRQR